MQPSLDQLVNDVDLLIHRMRPTSFDECSKLVASYVDKICGTPHDIEVTVKKVYYFGYLNGVKVFLRQASTQRQVNARGTVYSIHN